MQDILIALLCIVLACPPGRVNGTTYKRLDELEKLHSAVDGVPLSVNFNISSEAAASGRLNIKVYGTATGLLLKHLFYEQLPTTLQTYINASVVINPPEIPVWLEKEYVIVKEISDILFTVGKQYYFLLNLNWQADAEAKVPELRLAIQKARVLFERPTFNNVKATLEASMALLKVIDRESKRLAMETDLGLNSTYKFKFFEKLKIFVLDLKALDYDIDNYLDPKYLSPLKLQTAKDLVLKLAHAFIKRYSSRKPAGDCTTVTQPMDKLHAFILDLDYDALLSRNEYLVSLSDRVSRGLQSLIDAICQAYDDVTVYLHYVLMSLCTATRDHLKTLSRTLILQPLQNLREIMLVLQHAEIESGNPLNVEKFDPIFLEESIEMLNSNEPIGPLAAVEVMGTAFTKAFTRLYEAWTLHLHRFQQRLTKNSTITKFSNLNIVDTLAMFFAGMKEENIKTKESLQANQTADCNCKVSRSLLPGEMLLPMFVSVGRGNTSTDARYHHGMMMRTLPKMWEMIKGSESLMRDYEALTAQLSKMLKDSLNKVYGSDRAKIFVPGETAQIETGGGVEREVPPGTSSGSAPVGLAKKDLEAPIMPSNEEKGTEKNTLGAAKNALPAQRKPSGSKMLVKTLTEETCEPDASLREPVVEQEQLVILGQG